MTRVILATFFLLFTSNAISQAITVTTFVDGDTATALQVNNNFSAVVDGVNAIVRKDETLFNTAVGVAAIGPNNTGGANTAIGRSALFSNTTGRGNTAGGFNALTSNTLGNYNTASGESAL